MYSTHLLSLKVIEVELQSSVLSEVISNVNFKSSSEFCLVSSMDNGSYTGVTYSPSYWNVADGGANPTLNFFNSNVPPFSGRQSGKKG